MPPDMQSSQGVKIPSFTASGALCVGGGGRWDRELLVGGRRAAGVRGGADSLFLSAAAAARTRLLARA